MCINEESLVSKNVEEVGVEKLKVDIVQAKSYFLRKALPFWQIYLTQAHETFKTSEIDWLSCWPSG